MKLPPCRLTLASVGLALAVSSVFAADWALTGNLGAHDPTIIKEGDTWWCFTTGTGLPAKTSSDGLNWWQASPLFRAEDSWWRTYAPRMGNIDVWAPDVHRFAGRTWLYYCVSEFGVNNSAIGLMSCTSLAAGDWRDDGFVLGSRAGDTFNAIDPNLAIDATGAPWLAFGSWFDGIHVVALDPATMKPTGTVYAIARRANGIEGANIVYAGGYYHLFLSIDNCCQGVNSTYKISYGRAASITGPYLDQNGAALMSGGGTLLEVGGDRWKGPGGESVIDNNGAWVIARHAYDASNNGAPTLRIADLFFDAAGWPTFTAPAVAAPTISAQPVSVTVAPGGAAQLSVAASGAALAYQWKKDGVALAGATQSTLTFAAAQAANSGRYTVDVTNAGGTVTSAPAVLVVDQPRAGRLINLSVRTRAGTGDQTLIAGFVIAGSGTKPLLVRATGPTLAQFGVSAVLPDPRLELYRDATVIASNDSWAAAGNLSAITAVGGDKLGGVPLDAHDAVVLQSLDARSYTAQVKDAGSGQGIALVEVFDTDATPPGTADFDAQPRLTNVSARAQAGAGENALIAGFVINGNIPRRVLVRGIGPTLANFGVAGFLPTPQLRIFDNTGRVIAENHGWSSAPNQTDLLALNGHKLGAFTLDARDAAQVITLAAAAYTVQVSDVNNASGVALIEVYDAP
jgi:arabinan endo-1,5-alpha-L-arabinosidase